MGDIKSVIDNIMASKDILEDLLVRVPRSGRRLCASISDILDLALDEVKRLEDVAARQSMLD